MSLNMPQVGWQEYTVILILLLFNEIINLIYTTSEQKFLLLKLNVSYDTINYITNLQDRACKFN